MTKFVEYAVPLVVGFVVGELLVYAVKSMPLVVQGSGGLLLGITFGSIAGIIVASTSNRV